MADEDYVGGIDRGCVLGFLVAGVLVLPIIGVFVVSRDPGELWWLTIPWAATWIACLWAARRIMPKRGGGRR